MGNFRANTPRHDDWLDFERYEREILVLELELMDKSRMSSILTKNLRKISDFFGFERKCQIEMIWRKILFIRDFSISSSSKRTNHQARIAQNQCQPSCQASSNLPLTHPWRRCRLIRDRCQKLSKILCLSSSLSPSWSMGIFHSPNQDDSKLISFSYSTLLNSPPNSYVS